jgi:2-iminoacetate synthase ThiH
MGRGPQVEELKQALKLDSAQTVAVRALADSFRAETEPQRKEIERRMQLMRAAHDGGAGDDSLAVIRSGMRASLSDIQHHLAAFEDKVRLILRPDQLAAFDTWKKQQLERRESMQRGRQN